MKFLAPLLSIYVWCRLLQSQCVAACTAGACHMIHPAASARNQKHSMLLANKASGVFMAKAAKMATKPQSVVLLMGICVADRLIKQRVLPRIRQGPLAMFGTEESSQSEDNESSKTEQDEESETEVKDLAEESMSTAMVASIGFYKEFISPLLPPACRFLPTCSQYGVQAIQEFGPSKGAILIAWRLLRCSPIGGKGYDPPKWPPVAFTYSSY